MADLLPRAASPPPGRAASPVGPNPGPRPGRKQARSWPIFSSLLFFFLFLSYPYFSLLELSIARAHVYFGLPDVLLHSMDLGEYFSPYLLGFPNFVG